MVYRSEERDLCSCGVMREIKSCVGAQFEYVLCGGFCCCCALVHGLGSGEGGECFVLESV